MINRIEKVYGNLTVVQRSDYNWGVVGAQGEEIVPFGKYDWIDSFEQGLARVKIGKNTSNTIPNGNKWGIINEKGEEVLPVIYDEVWNFLGKNRYSTKAINNEQEHNIYFHDLNNSLPDKRANEHDPFDDPDYCEECYEVFHPSNDNCYNNGYNGDIDDAFDGCPDAYWNID
jgi:hypothetical protein